MEIITAVTIKATMILIMLTILRITGIIITVTLKRKNVRPRKKSLTIC